ncbi:lyase family protein [Paramicrobacterium fandaimingii]|uniref:lyase family protein n=1 Tax=Paramicrobacterium fandaimingii TaxID=2708079 RepID=UPI001EFF5833|nr:lyase family protein [Microbacterium fandaimingii]
MIDEGLLAPVARGHDGPVADSAFLDALVSAEYGLVAAYGDIGLAPADAVDTFAHACGVADRDGRSASGLDVGQVADAAVAGGNPVIPLVGMLRERMPREHRVWVHRGATSQDILDSAIMMVARDALTQVCASLTEAAEHLTQRAHTHRDDVAAARTLTQHAVPTTIGLRLTTWARGLQHAADRLAALELPAQLGGAGGTLASFVEITGSADRAQDLASAFAARAGAVEAVAPWHVTRWPVTELGDALVAALDAMGKLAGDITTLSRTEIAEVAEGSGGGSSAMPQKQNPTEAVLIRSAALRAPNLSATLHLASAFAVDERPDGAWHAEWPTLRDLLRLALGASWHVSNLARHLRVDAERAAMNLARSGGLVLSERLSLVLKPLIGADAVTAIVTAASAGDDLRSLVQDALTRHNIDRTVDDLLDPAAYTGIAAELVDRGRDTEESR